MSMKLAVVHRREQTPQSQEMPWTEFPADRDRQATSDDKVRSLTRSLTSPWTEDLAQAERYQVALVPLPMVDRIDKHASFLTNLQSVLVLPLTWKDVVTEVHSQDRRSIPRKDGETINFGLNSVEMCSMQVRRAGQVVEVTAMEFKLLRYFLSNPGRVISRDELLNEVWGFDNYPCTRTVDTHVWTLRQKLESDPAHPVHFLTTRSMGYRFLP